MVPYLLLLTACSGGGADAPSLVAASRDVTFGSLGALGSFVLEARVQRDRTTESGTTSTVEAFQLSWKDVDHFEVVETRDGRPGTRTLVVGGRAWFATGAGPLLPQRDAEPYRAQLAQTWDPWTAALEPFGERMVYTETDREPVEGRPTIVYTVSLAPLEKPVKRAWEPVALDGRVWVDEATAVRLLADVRGEARSGAATLVTQLQVAVKGVGVEPTLSAPPSAAEAPPAMPVEAPPRPGQRIGDRPRRPGEQR